jgi:hypothetical protein
LFYQWNHLQRPKPPTIPGTYTFQSFTNSPNCVNAFKQKASYPPMKPSPKTKSTNPLI